MLSNPVKPTNTIHNASLTVSIVTGNVKFLVVGGGDESYDVVKLLSQDRSIKITVIAERIAGKIKALDTAGTRLEFIERKYTSRDFDDVKLLIAATGNHIINEQVKNEASLKNVLVHVAGDPATSDFNFDDFSVKQSEAPGRKNFIDRLNNGEIRWRRLASQLIVVFALMVVGHIIISYLPLPSAGDAWTALKPHLTGKFFFFVLAGFLAQMVDGILSMGYGVTSATVLISTGISPVSVSAAIHTSEIFTTGVSGFSHYKFGNVNKKLFKHLVIPGVTGAILGAVVLVYLGEHSARWLMPIMAFYALFLGCKILYKAFAPVKNKKVKRVGWLAWVGGFLDSFGGGGWGPIVTSTLIAKGKSTRYTVGTVSLTEFFVTLASAFTFFITAGISHWNVVLGLLIGGSVAAPFAAKLAGKLPRKTMMILVGIMVIIWCARLLYKSIF